MIEQGCHGLHAGKFGAVEGVDLEAQTVVPASIAIQNLEIVAILGPVPFCFAWWEFCWLIVTWSVAMFAPRPLVQVLETPAGGAPPQALDPWCASI